MSINFLHHSAQCFHCSVQLFPLMLLVVSLHTGLHQFMEIHSTTRFFFPSFVAEDEDISLFFTKLSLLDRNLVVTAEQLTRDCYLVPRFCCSISVHCLQSAKVSIHTTHYLSSFSVCIFFHSGYNHRFIIHLVLTSVVT